ncbi:MAG: iron-sulfur cluster assembly protein [Arhodomonas sp.]|nr:iron-sulfur cluster assembly protein [Arhodomonas sp.]
MLTIEDLGILRELHWDGEELVVAITPTYSGCPAMRTIEQGIRDTVRAHGIDDVRIEERISPAWTTDWLSEAGREKLLRLRHRPTGGRSTSKRGLFAPSPAVACPRWRLHQHHAGERVRLDGVQGALPLRRTAWSPSTTSSASDPRAPGAMRRERRLCPDSMN